MNQYYKGTSAYKLEEYESYAKESQKKKLERKKSSIAQHRAICRLMIVGVIFAFAAASALVYVNVMALRASTDIDNLEKQLAMVVDENKQKEIEINQKLDMKVIEKRAINELGMQKPDNSQIIYVDVRKDNNIEVASNKGEDSVSLVDGIKNVFVNIQEYFN